MKDVRALADDYRIFEARYHYFNTQKLISLAFQKRAQEEIKLYTKNSSEKSFRYVIIIFNISIIKTNSYNFVQF